MYLACSNHEVEEELGVLLEEDVGPLDDEMVAAEADDTEDDDAEDDVELAEAELEEEEEVADDEEGMDNEDSQRERPCSVRCSLC